MSIISMVTSLFIGQPDTTAVVYTKYPLNAVGVTLTASGMTTGVYKYAVANEVNLVAAIATAFWVAGVMVNTFSILGVYVIKILSGVATAGVQRAEVMVEALTLVGVHDTNWLPVPVKFVAGGAVIGNAASGNAAQDDTCVASVVVRS